MDRKLNKNAQELYQSITEKNEAGNLDFEETLDELKKFTGQLTQSTVQSALKDCNSLDELKAFLELLECLTIQIGDDVEYITKVQAWFKYVVEALRYKQKIEDSGPMNPIFPPFDVEEDTNPKPPLPLEQVANTNPANPVPLLGQIADTNPANPVFPKSFALKDSGVKNTGPKNPRNVDAEKLISLLKIWILQRSNTSPKDRI
ncbi:MAG TPA: hypothetical protein V6D10_18380 [Trichocoleus sp.]|jgi:hypothetical protein